MFVYVSLAIWAWSSVVASEDLSLVIGPYAALEAQYPACDLVGTVQINVDDVECKDGRACVSCNFQETYGPQGARNYCIDKSVANPCSQLKGLYYTNIPKNDLWGFHGTTDPNSIEFMNRGKELKSDTAEEPLLDTSLLGQPLPPWPEVQDQLTDGTGGYEDFWGSQEPVAFTVSPDYSLDNFDTYGNQANLFDLPQAA